MKRSPRRKLIVSAVAVPLVVLAIVGGWRLHVTRPGHGLPYSARFVAGATDRWSALGGTWEVAGGTMRNDSNDRGSKLLTGSPNWQDYVVDGDVQLLGKGSVGILARVSEAEVGEDSMKGYFAGVRAVDNSLVLGAYDFAYHEVSKVVIPEPVRSFRWYHLRLQAEGCRIIASAWADGMPEIRTAPLNDPDCFRSGSIGLRSNGTGGVWRNVTVVPIAKTAVVNRPAPLPASPDPPFLQNLILPAQGAPTVPIQSISSLQYLAPFGSPLVSVRGSVVLTRPALFVQDSTGGVEIQAKTALPLKIGDEVEVTGQLNLDRFSPVIRNVTCRLVREEVPISPIVITANQAATGSYDGRFVQVEGRLQSMAQQQDGTSTLDLDAGTQSFHAILPAGRSQVLLKDLTAESRLRLRGVSVLDPRFNKMSDPFVVLVRSAEDVSVSAGPPWWRPSTLILASLVVLGLIFTGNHVYLLAKHWRLRAVAEERERLAHEIHDTLAQSFAGIGFQLQAIRNSVPKGAGALQTQVDQAMMMARTSHEEARRSITTLRPQSLGHTGLVPALRDCAERMVKNGNVAVETAGEDGGRAVPPRIKDTLYRIGQEAIANAIRHADPGKIRIRLERTRASVCLSIEDDGKGFVPDSGHSGFGLLGMCKRAESISAALTVTSTPGAGTRVEVKAAADGSRFPFGRWLRAFLPVNKYDATYQYPNHDRRRPPRSPRGAGEHA